MERFENTIKKCADTKNDLISSSAKRWLSHKKSLMAGFPVTNPRESADLNMAERELWRIERELINALEKVDGSCDDDETIALYKKTMNFYQRLKRNIIRHITSTISILSVDMYFCLVPHQQPPF